MKFCIPNLSFQKTQKTSKNFKINHFYFFQETIFKRPEKQEKITISFRSYTKKFLVPVSILQFFNLPLLPRYRKL